MLNALHRHCLLENPASTDSSSECRVGDSELSSPSGYAKSFALKCDVMVARCVGVLLKAICPLAVFWTVVAIAIPSLDGGSLWPWSHVRHKALEGVDPLLANLNAPSSVKVVIFNIRVGASVLHGSPHFILSGFGFPMSAMKRARDDSDITSARCSSSGSKRGGGDLAFLPTVADAFPFTAGLIRFGPFKNNELTKPGSCFINELWHKV